jgi:peptide/nickel transport system substrate-binding protein
MDQAERHGARLWLQRRLSRRQAVVGGAAVSAAFLAACSGSNNNTATRIATRQPTTAGTGATPGTAAGTAAARATGAAGVRTATPAVAAGPQPRRGGILHTEMGAAGKLPPLDFQNTAELTMPVFQVGHCYSRLLRYDPGPNGLQSNNTMVMPDAASKWEQPDANTIIVTLNPNVRFHNIAPANGRKLVADDVIYSFQRQRDLKFRAGDLPPTKQIQAVDPQTVRLDLSSGNVDSLAVLAWVTNNIINKERVEQTGNLNDPPVVGTGPFMLKSWDSATQVMNLQRNPDFFVQGLPYLDGFEESTLLDPATSSQTQLLAMRQKRTQAMRSVPIQNLDEFRKNADFHEVEHPSYGGATTFLWVATQTAPTNDPRVRQALSKAIDRKAINDTFYNGTARLTHLIKMPSEDAMLPQDEFQKTLARDVAGAKQLLQAAGVTNWTPTIATFAATTQNIAELIQQNLKDVGVNAKLQVIDIPFFLNQIKIQGQFELATVGDALTSSTTQDLTIHYKTGGTWNGPKLSDPQLDQWIDQQGQEFDKNKRYDLLKQIQRKLLDLLAFVPLSTPPRNGVTVKELHDFDPAPGAEFYERWNWVQGWLEQ